jgi:2-oxoisovalerate dehydrogenase E1 component
LPVIFCIQDNGYAISVPKEKQSMGEGVGHTFCCYQNLKMLTFDGTDYLASVKAAKEAIEYINSGRGPVLMHALVERLLPHSSSDDHRKYRKEDELNRIHTENDCIKILANYLVDFNLSNEDEINNLWDEVKKEIDEAADWAWEQPDPIAEESTLHVFAPEETRNLPYAKNDPTEGQPIVLVDAVNHALAEEMRLNPKMLIFGEDIADPKGGVFTATRGLTTNLVMKEFSIHHWLKPRLSGWHWVLQYVDLNLLWKYIWRLHLASIYANKE